MRLSFRQVFEDRPRIIVPLLQRDFAQGRPSARDVRERFLDVLLATLCLPPSDETLPLDLDFVYGSPDDRGAFSPLDGQQRLTTLFLLHWYLSMHDREEQDFRNWAFSGGSASFSYGVRPSSKDFFDALVQADVCLDALAAEPTGLSDLLRDQPWFFQSWELDPTIRSCLVVLDAIHARFQGSKGLYRRLVDLDAPPITFQFLNLKEFGLTDDLYIKMNARGKALTVFETFKANFEQCVGEEMPGATRPLNGTPVALNTYVAQRFDTAWCDLFWTWRSKGGEHDQLTMNAIRVAALVGVVREPPALPEADLNALLDDIRVGKLKTFYDYQGRQCLGRSFIDGLVGLFDLWSADGEGLRSFLRETRWYDEAQVFEGVLLMDARGRGTLPYDRWLQIYAWCEYLLSGLPLEGLRDWMRVVVNLTENSIYNRVDEFRLAVFGLRDWLRAQGAQLLKGLAQGEIVPGFFARQQVREERLKAQLMLRSEAWRTLIEEAETHGYFRGQIEFLFDFCGLLQRWLDAPLNCNWDDAEDEQLRQAFSTWFERANALFRSSPAGLKPLPDFVWERALLCEGDYLLTRGSNHGFLEDSGRQLSWKRLLRADLRDESARDKRDIVRRVLQMVDTHNVEGSLRARIAQGVAEEDGVLAGWRARLVERPELLGYCGRRQVRIVPDNAIYLLSGERRSGYHRELFTAHLENELRPRVEAGEFAPFDKILYDEVRTDSEAPSLELRSSERADLTLSITFAAGEFQLIVEPEELADPDVEASEGWRVPVRDLQTTLKELLARAHQLDAIQ